MFEDLIGFSGGWRKIPYNWRDVSLYALAVGADENDLMYVYEKGNMKVVPSYGVVPYWNAVNCEPQQPLPAPCVMHALPLMSREAGIRLMNNFHMGQELVIHRPMDAIKGTMVFEDRITAFYDRGPGRGGVLETTLPVYDEAGNLLCENHSRILISSTEPEKQFGGFGGPPLPKPAFTCPERAPDFVIDSSISKTQNMLYRLTGDTNEAHIDVKAALRYDPNGVFMQGLCSMGMACLMLCKKLLPGEPERMTKLSVQMRAPAYPGSAIQLQAWRESDRRVVFRMADVARGRNILDNCVFEWKD